MTIKANSILIASAIALMLLSGCTRLRAHRGYVVDPVLTTSVSPGIDDKRSVEDMLGRPTFVGQFNESEWFYVSRNTKQLAFSRPKPERQTVLRVRFDERGQVVDVAETGVELAVNLSPDGDATPTLGRERGFFEDLFGNIGAVGAGGPGGPGGPVGPGGGP
ncbi:outer membrane protein assembly factor BamE [Alterisphingorhabdus coralli]|uniref:Outer membrane protein assembly factor BamE n=1 Tax=Alterisphingorhabdus coralli TaxID=3071408 RepID=A0AA97F8X3_9SPHN|nr:outer membrane protein assembly factor BamE [Parasphingorhabdus sp. SCSIO 66989]WOE75207.1 outer membrane protein assembly factor BamE [Parasphingorhabdus sp. SCSIO 66989]